VNWTGIVLAGGLARRMGGEKPLAELNGRTLLQHAIDLVRPLVDEVVVSSGMRSFELPAEIRVVPDRPEWQRMGPLAGIASSLEHAAGDAALLVPCDLPRLPSPLLQDLQAELAGYECVYFRGQSGPEPLVAALRVAPALRAARDALQSGRLKVVPCWESLAYQTLSDEWVARHGSRDELFRNVNTLQDLDDLS
jgi:molybdopterin-guanine dinucleotide biosynthesis protein A